MTYDKRKENRMPFVLLIGGLGSIGSSLYQMLSKEGFQVIRTTSRLENMSEENLIFPLRPHYIQDDVKYITTNNMMFDAIIWAHGMNWNDSLSTWKSEEFENMMNVNLQFTLESMKALCGWTSLGGAWIVLSSIYEQRARPHKVSYSISKAALGGLIRSMSCDPMVTERKISVNNVCCGPIENEMTRRTLTSSQREALAKRTFQNRLLQEEEVGQWILFLCQHNKAMTGQSIILDGGLSVQWIME